FVLSRLPSTTTLFPYTTLFRSMRDDSVRDGQKGPVPLAASQRRFVCRVIVHDQALVLHSVDCAISSAGGDDCHRAIIVYSAGCRSEEHTSELQSHLNLVCRLLL